VTGPEIPFSKRKIKKKERKKGEKREERREKKKKKKIKKERGSPVTFRLSAGH
jgi:hypothetical protein